MITDHVVPGSAVKINVPEKDGFSIWTLIVFNENVEI